MLEATRSNQSTLERAFREMEREARAALRLEGFTDTRQRHERRLAVRYLGQSFELEIKWARNIDIPAAFHSAHLSRYGYAQKANQVEIVSARLRSSGLVEKLRQTRKKGAPQSKRFAQPKRYAKVYFSGGEEQTAIYHRDELERGARLRSPSVVTEYSATTLIPPGAACAVDDYGNLIITP